MLDLVYLILLHPNTPGHQRLSSLFSQPPSPSTSPNPSSHKKGFITSEAKYHPSSPLPAENKIKSRSRMVCPRGEKKRGGVIAKRNMRENIYIQKVLGAVHFSLTFVILKPNTPPLRPKAVKLIFHFQNPPEASGRLIILKTWKTQRAFAS